jgi:hypothetical protein
MKCPHCQEQIPYDSIEVCLRSAERYHNAKKAVVGCCGQMVTITPRTSFDIEKYYGTETEDDWGSKVKRLEKS